MPYLSHCPHFFPVFFFIKIRFQFLKMDQATSEKIVDNVFKVLIEGSKQDYIGERISQLEHCLQAASQALDASKDNQIFICACPSDSICLLFLFFIFFFCRCR